MTGSQPHRIVLNGGKKLLPVQRKIIQSEARVKVALGAYGSGKTTAAALALLQRALQTPWTEDYGEDLPTSLVVGKTQSVLKDSSYRAVKALIPKSLIRKELKSPSEQRMVLDNGHQILFRSWSGAIEGMNVAGAVLIDECHLLDADVFTNLVARARDPRSGTIPHIILSGIPLRGWLMEFFGPGSHYPDAEVFHASTYENFYLSSEAIERIRASCTAEDAETYLLGKWHTPRNVLIYAYNPSVHVIPMVGDKSKPVHIGMDPGEKSAVLFLQAYKDGYMVVDELSPNRKSIRELLRDVLARGWKLQAGYSKVYIDPTSGRDQLNAVEDTMPKGVEVIRKNKKADVARSVEYGLRCINTAFLDSNGKTRLWLSDSLDNSSRGIKASFTGCVRNEQGYVIKNNENDHMLDALRYPVADLMPLLSDGFSVHKPSYNA